MEPPPSKPASIESSGLYDLNLPVVGPGEGPLPHAPPSYELQQAHARWLIEFLGPDIWEKRRAQMNPEPFRLDEPLG